MHGIAAIALFLLLCTAVVDVSGQNRPDDELLLVVGKSQLKRIAEFAASQDTTSATIASVRSLIGFSNNCVGSANPSHGAQTIRLSTSMLNFCWGPLCG
jgi:hypothetical protein